MPENFVQYILENTEVDLKHRINVNDDTGTQPLTKNCISNAQLISIYSFTRTIARKVSRTEICHG
jgi:hypothetical protein